VVGEDERWRCGGRALGTSGRTARTCGRVAGEGGMAHEPVSSAVGRHGARADEVGGRVARRRVEWQLGHKRVIWVRSLGRRKLI
jgi:hypothetical protein